MKRMALVYRKAINDRQRAFVSIVVLLMVVLLAVVLLEFNYESRVNLHAADNSYRSLQALGCAEAGINIAIAALNQFDNVHYDEAIDKLLSGATQIPVGDGYCTVSVVEENGKINVNLLKEDGHVVRHRVDRMLHLIDILNHQYGERSPIGYGIVPAIVDWVDADDDVTYFSFVERENEGAEKEYYERQTPPYACKNGPLDAINELLLIKGMTSEMYEGRAGDENKGVTPVTGMGALLTIYGDGKIDINHAPAEVIESLSEKMNSALAQSIIAERTRAPFSSISALQRIPGITPEIYGSIKAFITVRPQEKYYRVTATGVVQDFTRSVNAVLRRDSKGDVTFLLREEP